MKFLILFLFTFLPLYCLSAYELSIAAIFRDEGAYLKEWIEYHKMVGVEHFWLYNNSSTDDWEEILQPYIAEGVVEVINWPFPSQEKRVKYQEFAYKDALDKAIGMTNWLAVIDLDEYLLPMKEKTITECLKKHFSNAAAVYVNWRCFGTGGITLKKKESCLFRLRACSHPLHPVNAMGKSIVRPDYVQYEVKEEEAERYIHQFPLRTKTGYYNGDGKEIPITNENLTLDAHGHTRFLRINHYTMRDESFFHTIKFIRNREGGISDELTLEHYHAFNLYRDEAIIGFIRAKHPDIYEKFWKSGFFLD